MRTDAFDFDLPEDRIALRPAAPRDAARLLEICPGDPVPLIDRVVRDLPGRLRAGDVLIVNDTRVAPARLYGVRAREGATARVEALLTRRLDAASWLALARPAKKFAPGDRVIFGVQADGGACLLDRLDATVVARGEGGEVRLAFDLSGPDLDDAVRRLGHMPLPPYIAAKRPDDARDREDYQTLFADEEGSVAAPTAGLHFTPDLLARIADRGVTLVRTTLHVGAGTFLPVKTAEVSGHRLHAEWGRITPDAAAAITNARRGGGRAIAVGTTALRLIESAAMETGVVAPFEGETDIFITPGYRFRIADGLMTNFHLPRSTLFMLVCAFAGVETMRAAYAHAIAAGYRFYSYGDASLIWRAPKER